MKNSILLFAILLIGAVSCKKENKGIEEHIVIELVENISPKRFSFDCQTITVYNGGMMIGASVSRNGNSIAINLGMTSIYSDFPVKGPAVGTANIGILANGVYFITINNGKKQSNGILTVTDESYSLSFDRLSNISFKHTQLYRIPAQTIWGMVKYRNATQAGLVSSFTDSLVYFGAQPFAGADGYYGYFNKSGGAVTVSNSRWPNYEYVDFFVYKYTGNKSNIDTLVRSFGLRNIDSAFINVATSDGNIYEFPWPVEM